MTGRRAGACESVLQEPEVGTNGRKVLVAVSGGVDSSTAAALLLEAGFACTGVFMITNAHYERAQSQAEDAARRLGIRLDVLDLRQEFEQIIEYLCSEYAKGRTPNPCVVCNSHIKFGKLWEFARRRGLDHLSTGHYARVINDSESFGLYSGTDSSKDQSYAMSMIDKQMLAHMVLPIGNHSKKQVRELAARFGLGTEHRSESQEICFIPDNDYVAVLEKRCPELARRGRIVDSGGKVLGEHLGVHRFTVGQRRGLGMAMGRPYYVVGIEAATNTVTLGPKEEVMHRKLLARGVNWLTDGFVGSFRAKVKIRYNDEGSWAAVTPEAGAVVIEFDEPKLAITPGQLAVFYVEDKNGSRVIGGGWIEETAD